MAKSDDEGTEVFRISISTNRKAIASLLDSTEVKLSDDSLKSLARLVSAVVIQLQDVPRSMTPKERSEHAILGGQKPPDDLGLLINTREATKLLNVSSRKLWEMENSGKMPKAVRIGRAVRWSYAELQAWIGAGCPPRERWKYKPDKS